MIRFKKLLYSMFFVAAVLCCEASAKEQVKCAWRITDQAAEPELENGARTYKVRVTCKMWFIHCKTGQSQSEVYSKTYTGEEAITVPVNGGRKVAEQMALAKLDGEAQQKLEKQCKDKGCTDCTVKRCECGCGS